MTASDDADLPQSAPRAMRVRIRPEVLAFPRYVAGKSQPGAAKLSSNENPEPPTPDVIEAAGRALEDANRYPDMGAVLLRSAIADHLGVESDQICVGTGSSGVLVAALSAVCAPGGEVVHPWRSFESYPIAIPTAGGVPVPVALDAHDAIDLEAMARAVGPRTAAVILCSPNNPTGPALRLEDVRAFLRRTPQEVLVILDEAYIEMATAPGVGSAVPLLGEFPNLLVLRTFSKVYALAGLRVGYGVAHRDLTAAVTAVSLPFGVSSVAQAAALAALADQGAVARSVRLIVAERERMLADLRGCGYRVPDSQANFVWLPADQSGPAFVQACSAANLVVRPFPEGVRVSVGRPEDDDRFLEVARAFRGA
ncbi:MAG: histidinol-phosphate transaminase [Actinomyces sp.]|nr:histidinol-phosphate transaminase [Actinomyces sp.]MCI1641484.1 histidinol-phosphate transaminase [Actinomyces sp.]MCI1661772.1 histidinol-phosphate transaminase [Actinomyces sp.]MCI1690520.1 histidinol-phosphate transaminase [Actinomyces sp.]MCI1786501.1 histidinol-phosphate transaminase [Actinomyces sp.]MCI1829978.1 histidinol-phosphate transaminase [Actinomyces sp.]